MAEIFTLDDSPIYLREMVESDVTDRYLSWFTDDAVTAFLEAKNLTKKEVIDHLHNGRETATYFMYAIIAKDRELHIGNVKIGPISYRKRVSDLVTVIGDRNYWGKGIGTHAIGLGNSIAFEKYGMRKLTAGIHSKNIGSMKAYSKAGWVSEGRLIGHDVIDGESQDIITVSRFSEQYFDFIDGAYRPK